MVDYSDEEYNQHLKDIQPDWTKEETDYLFDLCRQYDLRFIVIQDRYDYRGQDRTVEEIKNRYYTCARHLLYYCREQKEHPIVQRPYNIQYEQRRKFNMEKIMSRTKAEFESEKKIVEDLKKFDLKIKKLEKEEKSINRILNSKDLLEEDKDEDEKKSKRKAGASLRSAKIHAPLPNTLSPTLIKKMEIVMEELGVNDDVLTCTETVAQKYEQLQLLIIRMLCIEKHVRNTDVEIGNVAEKERDLKELADIVSEAPAVARMGR